MRPLSGRRRKTYLVVFFALALALMPAAIFYADGWRFKAGIGLIRTGGIFVSTALNDALIFIDDKQVGSTSIISHGQYVDDLAPSSYEVKVTKTGYREWKRIIIVEPQIVTDVRARLIPSEILVEPLLVSDLATSTPHISKDTALEYTDLFAVKRVASSTVPVDVSDGIGLFIDGGTLSARWMSSNKPASAFCGRPSFCAKEFPIEDRAQVTHAEFLGGEVLYRTSDGSIYLSEIDARLSPQRVKLFSAKGADFILVGGRVIIKSGKSFLQIDKL